MFVRVYTGKDGQSHFEDLELPIGLPSKAAAKPAVSISFADHSGGHFPNWHNAPRKQYVIILSGTVEFAVGDGTVRRCGPGDVVLAEDMTGQGHTSRNLAEHRIMAAIPLA